ncbi:hypothetical protein D3C87_300700 [compost metagenome]
MLERDFKIILIAVISVFTTAGCALDASILDMTTKNPIFEKATNAFEPISGKSDKVTTLRGYQIEQSVGYPLSERHVITTRGYSFTFGSEAEAE